MSITHIPFYPSDWLAGTRGLSAEESGVYITLVAKMYEMAGPIEEDHERLHRICGTKSKAAFKKALEYLVSEGKIVRVEGGLFNEKCAEVIGKVVSISSQARSAAEARWKKKPNKNNDGRDADASSPHMRDGCQPKPKPKEEAKASSAQTPQRFEEFWDAYPHRGGAKKGKQPSLVKYTAAVKRGVPEGVIIDGARRYRSDRGVLDGYAKDPATWLNQQGWADEIEPKFSAIHGGQHGKSPSKSEDRLSAFIAGARGAS